MKSKIEEDKYLEVELGETQIQFLIDNHTSSMRFYIFYALGVVSLGVLVFSFSDLIAVGDGAINVAKIGGGFVSTLSLFPIKEVIKRKDKKHALKFLIISLHQDPDALKKSPKTQQLIWDYLHETLVS